MAGMNGETLRPDQTVRLLRAKAADLENRLRVQTHPNALDYLGADLALIATLLADHIEFTTR